MHQTKIRLGPSHALRLLRRLAPLSLRASSLPSSRLVGTAPTTSVTPPATSLPSRVPDRTTASTLITFTTLSKHQQTRLRTNPGNSQERGMSTTSSSPTSASSTEAKSNSNSNSNSLESIRSAIRSKPVSIESFAKNPVEQFVVWFKDAWEARVMMPNSMVLSTAQLKQEGSNTYAIPASRAVLLKDIVCGDEMLPIEMFMRPEAGIGKVKTSTFFPADHLPTAGFTFVTNYESRKGEHIQANPYVSLYFIWHELERAVRIEGTIEKVPEALSDHYHHSRPRSSRIAACSSQQSRPIESYDEFTRRYERLVAQFDSQRETNPAVGDRDVPRPPNWGGYLVRPLRMEFWQGRPSRTHERLDYQLNADGTWQTQYLQP